MEDREGSESVFEPSKPITERSYSRRSVLKWGIVGSFAVFPVALVAYRSSRKNGYEYVLKGPFRLTVLGRFDNDKQHVFQESDWVGNFENRSYTPHFAYLVTNLREPLVELHTQFLVKEEVPDGFGANVRITVETKKGVIASEDVFWDAPHKKWVLNPMKQYHSDWQDESMVNPYPIVSAFISFPVGALTEITGVRFRIEELPFA